MKYKVSPKHLALYKLTNSDIRLFYIKFTLTVLSLLVSVCSEKYATTLDNEGQSPEHSCSVISRLTFAWVNPILSEYHSII